MKPASYLTKNGKIIFKTIESHLSALGADQDSSSIELSMLSNSLDLYSKAAAYINKYGTTQVAQSGYEQVHPNYTILNKEYASILKHSPKFGLNPSDLSKLLSTLPEKEKEDPLSYLRTNFA